MYNKNQNGGLIKLIIVIIIAIAILSWYGIDIKEFFTSPQAKENFGFIWNFIKDIWSDYLAEPAEKLWNFLVDYVWEPLIDMLKRGDHTN